MLQRYMDTEFFEFLREHPNTTVLSWESDFREITTELEVRDMQDIESKAENLGYERARRNDKNTHTYPASITFQKV